METLNLHTSDKTKPVKIFMDSKDEIGKVAPLTVPEMFEKVVENYPDHPAMKHKTQESSDWEVITYRNYKEKVDQIAKVFIKLGLERHGTVAILAFNSVEWFVSELAAIHAG